MPSSTTHHDDVPTHECPLPDGRTLAYAVAGDPDGTPVVVHHGTPGSRLFARLLADAAGDAGAKLLVPDRPGYGRSDAPPPEWTWTDYREDVEALLDAESAGGAGVLGFSGGGPFALATGASDRATRVALVSAVIPPADDGLAKLSTIPFAIRGLFGLTAVLSRVTGPGVVVGQYTDRDLDDAVADAVVADFREALRQSGRAAAREARLFATEGVDPATPTAPVRAYHGTRDENTPVEPVRAYVQSADGEVLVREGDHLGTLLDCRSDALSWLAGDR